jgi:hypothetical protein
MRNRIMIFCQNCGKEFQIRPARLGTAKYCSRSCHNQAMSETTKALWADPNSGFRNMTYRHSPGTRQKMSVGIKAAWADPSSGFHNRKDAWITRRAKGEVSKLKGKTYEEIYGKKEARRVLKIKSQSAKQWWEGLTEEERERASEQSRVNGAKSIGLPVTFKPSIPEALFIERLDREFPGVWKYVGNGQVWIAGKNPDFLNVNGQKLLIETFTPYYKERDYGSVEAYIEQRGAHFAEYGFRTLFLDLYEKNWDLLIKQVRDFVGGK